MNKATHFVTQNTNQSITHSTGPTREFVSLEIGDQLFGVEVTDIRDVFALKNLTPVPGAKPHIAGVLNLRGRIVTAIDARQKLKLGPKPQANEAIMAVGVEHAGEPYSILVDRVGDVLRLNDSDCVPNPANLDPDWKKISRGVYRLEGKLLITIDIDRFLASDSALAAGA
jgi:purine-binding chemotaxis protein CheW